jgi:alkylated DNA repair dioxygenase AlkB
MITKAFKNELSDDEWKQRRYKLYLYQVYVHREMEGGLSQAFNKIMGPYRTSDLLRMQPTPWWTSSMEDILNALKARAKRKIILDREEVEAKIEVMERVKDIYSQHPINF